MTPTADQIRWHQEQNPRQFATNTCHVLGWVLHSLLTETIWNEGVRFPQTPNQQCQTNES